MQNSISPLRYLVIAVLIGGVFFGAYSFASARSRTASVPATASKAGLQTAANNGGAGGSGSAAGGSGCACCGSSAPTANGVTGDELKGSATVTGDVQKIDIDLSKGYYQPNVITLKAGVPAEITFGQSTGCTGQVISSDLGFSEDLTAGPRTVTIDNPTPGEYAFSCGMQMVYGKIVVQ
ncbi:MAG TPA: cupredoxin domain-containing protein [Coriobacteriia bacterium]|nr:cupredoxin domain-containing protein [Coriobacteriia bacterium]